MGVTDPIVQLDDQRDQQFWLDAAHGAVRGHCGWHVAPVITETLTLDGSGSTALLLPSGRVWQILRVANDGRDVTSQVKFSRRTGVVTLASRWTRDVGSVEIELTHGYSPDEVPEVAGLIATLQKRGAAGSPTVAQQNIGPAGVRYVTTSDGGRASIPLLQSEKEILAPYVLKWGA
jgi:hypothetical protein